MFYFFKCNLQVPLWEGAVHLNELNVERDDGF